MGKTLEPRRIVSFLPSATEMVFALGLGDRLVGVTHECDFPPEAREKPVVVRSAVPTQHATAAEIDRMVRERLHGGQSLYQVDEALLKKLRPELILTQDLCQVCAPSGNEVSQVLRFLSPRPEILWMTPKCLEDILSNLQELAQRTGRADRAERILRESRTRIDRIRGLARGLAHRPRVFCMEWTEPLYCAGHWVPEMVEIAGGFDALGRKGEDSTRITWDEVRRWSPEILFVSPCGCHLDEAAEEARRLTRLPGWDDLPCVRSNRVFAVDSSSYLSRPGPRIVLGVEMFAHLLHPESFPWRGPADAFSRISDERSEIPGRPV